MKYSSRWIAVAAVLLLAACGDDPSPQTAAPTVAKPKPAPMSAAQLEANKQMAEMTSAVRTDNAAPIAAVKFELKTRPELGKPLTIRMAFIAPMRAENLSATYAADQGLVVATTQTPAEFTALEAAMPYFHEVTVVPKANGVQYMSAVVQVQGAVGEPRIQTFFVPVVVGMPPAGS